MSIFRKLALVFAASITGISVWGQAARSPYSAFGIGEAYSPALSNTQGMAGVGVAAPQYWYINAQNPALLVYNTLTEFAAGVVVEQRRVVADTSREQATAGNLNYLITAFPIKPGKWTTSLALTPFTSYRYRVAYLGEVVGTTNRVRISEEGTGGISQLSWANGVRINEDFSVGLKASYLFGSIVNTYRNQLIDTEQLANYLAAFEEKSYVRDFTFSAGVAFSKDSLFSKQKYRISIGATYDLGTDLNTTRRDKLYRTTLANDTVEAFTLGDIRGNTTIPSALTVGVSIGHSNRWTLGTEFSYRDWTDFRNVVAENQSLGQAWRAALGYEITPDGFSEKYLKRVTYRTGASIERYPFLANGNEVRDLGINVGLSLPAGQSSIDLAFRYGRRGDRSVNIIEENYIKIYFGITFNDRWFIKRKFD